MKKNTNPQKYPIYENQIINILGKIHTHTQKKPNVYWWWFQTLFISPLFGEDEPILTHIFQWG